MIGPQTQVRFSFSAIQHADGSVTGEVQDKDGGPTLQFHGKVFDLKVDGNRAKISWTFTSGTVNPPLVPVTTDLTGWVASVVVIDNGEGNNATGPDMISRIYPAPPGTFFPPINMTIEQLNALGVADYLEKVLFLTGASYSHYVAAIETGSVQVR